MDLDETFGREGNDPLMRGYPLASHFKDRYRANIDIFGEKDIADYVESQVPEEEIWEVQHIKFEFLHGVRYDMWQVITKTDRYWVINNANNLYSHQHFPDLDYTFSFHVGLMARLAAESDLADQSEPTMFDEVIRRHEQATDMLERAVEFVDYQAVGMQLREALISLVKIFRRIVEPVNKCDHPKAADVIGWNKFFTSQIYPGDKNDEIRNYLRAIVEKAWQLVNWLTHHRNAERATTEIAVAAVDAIIKHYIAVCWDAAPQRVDHCPQCKSKNIRIFFDPDIQVSGEYFEECSVCGWDNHP